MRKMGWREGEGLGKNKEGSVEPIMVDFKTDRKGESCLSSASWLLSSQGWDFASGLPMPGVSPELCPGGEAVGVVVEQEQG